MNSGSLTLTVLVASATFILGMMVGHLVLGEFVPKRTGTAAQVNIEMKQDREKTIVDLINENP